MTHLTRLVDELLDVMLLAQSIVLPDLALLLYEHGRGADYVSALERLPAVGVWFEASSAVAAGELVRTAEIYKTMGTPFLASWALLLAAERGDAAGLDRARTYFAAQGATPFLRRCEALLPATA